MIRLLIGLAMLSAMPLCWADELTDAITGVDPRIRLQSGRGAALHDMLGPKEAAEEEPSGLEEDLDSATTLPSYGLTTKDLLDPMGTADEEDEESLSDEPEEADDAIGGFANQEAGVHYQDAYSPGSSSY